MKKTFLVIHLLSAVTSLNAQGAGFDFTNAAAATDAAVADLLKPVALGADERPLASGRELGTKLGLDAGVGLTVIAIPQSFKDALTLMGSTANFGSTFLLPRYMIRKGFPKRFDVSFSTLRYQQFDLIGADIQWSAIPQKGKRPAIALRAAYNQAAIDVVHTSTRSVDLVFSRNYRFIEPYIAVGYQMASGTLEVASLPTTVSATQDFTSLRWTVGLPLKLGALHATLDYSGGSAGITSYGAKFSLNL